MTPERQLEILTGTRNLIADPKRWGKGRFITQQTAVDRFLMRRPRMCLMGAVSVAATGYVPPCSSDTRWTEEVRDIGEFLVKLVPANDHARSAYGMGMMAWNDQHEHAEVIGLLDVAIFETMMSASTQNEQHQSDDGEDDQNRPKHPPTVPLADVIETLRS